MGRNAEAAKYKTMALDKANATQLYVFARQLQNEKKADEALTQYQTNAKKFPEHWTTHLGLARYYSAKGDFDKAVKEANLAIAGAPEANKAPLENLMKRLQSKDDINR
jgi:tetratricopeptide (TPR) repeat protein